MAFVTTKNQYTTTSSTQMNTIIMVTRMVSNKCVIRLLNKKWSWYFYLYVSVVVMLYRAIGGSIWGREMGISIFCMADCRVHD